MNENIIELIIFPWFFAALIGFIYYQINKLSGYFTEIKETLSQNHDLIHALNTKLTDLDIQIKAQEVVFHTLQKGLTHKHAHGSGVATADLVVSNYERAKGFMQRGVSLDRDVLRNCNITEEEMELLSDTVDAHLV